MAADETSTHTETEEDGAPTIADADAQQTIKEEALKKEGHAHAQTGMRLTILGAAGCAVLLQLVVHKRPIHWVITGLLVLIIALATYIHATARHTWRAAHPARTSLGVLMAATGVAATGYLGVLSSTALVLVIIVWSFATNDHLGEAWAVYLICALGYLGLTLLTYFGVMPLTGSVLALTKENLRALFGLTILLEMLLAMVFWLAWTGRRATVDAIGHVARARVEIERRRALLDEARADLRQAQDAARHGRFTGCRVGDYRAGEIIGRGAMGEVYAAEALADARRVALKVLHPHLIDSPADVERFVRELRMTEALDSPNIVRVLGTGTAPDQSPYLAMERLEGSDLATLLRNEARLQPREVLGLISDVARALATSEKAGIVHRDVKPQNLFRVEGSDGPIWKVLDFGVSRLVDVQSSLTHGVIGTPAYMAPEQVSGHRVDHRADVFSLAAVAYRALTGRPAFSGPDQFTVLFAVANAQPAKPGDLAMLPADVELVLALGLSKDPELRFQTAPELADALRSALHNALPQSLRERAEALLSTSPWDFAPSQGGLSDA